MTSRGEQPCLEHRPDADGVPVRVPLEPLPFRIGRSHAADFVVPSPRISKLHAEIVEVAGEFRIRDLGSRNGTFVNGEPVADERPIAPGDVVHVAHRELRFVLARPTESVPPEDATLGGTGSEAEERRLRGTRDLYRILSRGTVRAVFQPIVTLDDLSVIGFEALGRPSLPTFDHDVTSLFRIAAERGRADELSRLMRGVACADAGGLPEGPGRTFMNVHPDEMHEPRLLEELERANEAIGERILVVEVHEAAVTDPRRMRQLRSALHDRGMELAYDDFGAGRSRLMELAEVPPDYLKLDMSLIRGIEQSAARQDLVAAFLKVMNDSGILVVAEGIESEAERQTCARLGCVLGQGFLFRRPMPISDLSDSVA